MKVVSLGKVKGAPNSSYSIPLVAIPVANRATEVVSFGIYVSLVARAKPKRRRRREAVATLGALAPLGAISGDDSWIGELEVKRDGSGDPESAMILGAPVWPRTRDQRPTRGVRSAL